jgi:hypothetical protein
MANEQHELVRHTFVVEADTPEAALRVAKAVREAAEVAGVEPDKVRVSNVMMAAAPIAAAHVTVIRVPRMVPRRVVSRPARSYRPAVRRCRRGARTSGSRGDPPGEPEPPIVGAVVA